MGDTDVVLDNKDETALSLCNHIQSIDELSVSRICSNQVILNLAVAVKELVENSVDAGATIIDIRLKEFGTESIEVIDNGCGVHDNDLQGLTLKHHTSKLKKYSDLSFVSTFGFRGEALNALCALANVSISTCHSSSSCGSLLEFDNEGHIINKKPCARQIGTTVTIKNLFITMPVRHKDFARNMRREFSKMQQILHGYCLVTTGVRITCSNQVKKGSRAIIVATQGCDTIRENIVGVFGTKQVQQLMEIVQEKPSTELLQSFGLPEKLASVDPTFKLEGFASSCAHGEGRAAPDRQFFFVNSRPCEPQQVIKAVNDTYHIFNKRQYPFVFLNIKMEQNDVDVNLTPDKRKVLLHQEKLLTAYVKASFLKMYESVPSTLKINNVYEKLESPISGTSSLVTAESRTSNIHNSNEEIMMTWGRSSSTSFNSLNTSQSTKRGIKRSLEIIRSGRRGSGKQKCLNSFFSEIIDKNDAVSSNVLLMDNLDRNPIENHSQSLEVCEILENKNIIIDSQSSEQETTKSIEENETAVTRNCSYTCQKFINHETIFETTYRNGLIPEQDMQKINSSVEENMSNIIISYDECSVINNSFIANPIIWSVDMNILLQDMEDFSVQEHYADNLTLESHNKFTVTLDATQSNLAEHELRREITKDMFPKMIIIGQFNKGFIIAQLDADLFIIDQHASDEIYNFETLQKTTKMQTQNLIAPLNLDLSYAKENILIENIEIFQRNGFDFSIDENGEQRKRLMLKTIPLSKNWTFGKDDVDELLFMLEGAPHSHCRPSRVRAMFASRACRKSVMIGTDLSKSDMRRIVDHMGEINNPWNCPHGRPTMRHLINFEIFFKNKLPQQGVFVSKNC